MKALHILLFLLISINCNSQNLELIKDSILNEGLRLYKLEKTAWISTDLILAKPSNSYLFNDYSSYFDGDTVKVIYYSQISDIAKIKFTARYNIEHELKSENVKIVREIRKPTEYESKLIKLKKEIRTLIEESPNLSKNKYLHNFNITVLEKDSLLMFYLLPGTTKNDMFYLGGDYIIYYSNHKGFYKIKAQHKGLIEVKLPEEGLEVYYFMHSHIKGYSNFMTATDICQAKLYSKLTVGLSEYKVISQFYESTYNIETDILEIKKR